ncbi:hypothetical protein PVA45_00790 [Entomospira entomophila]|uniref:Lipoprotein n=1 Tax=Entomospira entomophila TaxID=2719988 RepID=A0A968G8R1_9SPIO|nr:hypothetical protein [Entomospira entomophilus]NIZ40056.1 hypothetical protein [Entomospira entomophilus]WDI35617.1 hypothetical protein PVA45_00790 [Entomospira entomophilus]
MKKNREYHRIGLITVSIIALCASLTGCSKPSDEGKDLQIRSALEESKARIGDYPFAVGFGATLQELMQAEGRADATLNLDVMTTYEYVRQWQGLKGTLSYLYLKEDDAVVALSFDIPLGMGVSVDDVTAIAEKIYAKPTPELYVQFLELEPAEAVRLYESPESQGFFWTHQYLIQVEEKPNAGVINVLYVYMHPNSADHTHQHSH